MDEASATGWREVFSVIEIHAVEKALREIWGLLLADSAWVENALHVLNERQFSESIVLKFDELIRDAEKWAQHPILEILSQTFDPHPVYDAASSSRRTMRAGLPVFDTIPDFYFRRPTRPGRSPMTSGLFMEAKIIDHKKLMGNYCGKGLVRFVDGRYAWDMPQGLMLGYVRNTAQKLPHALVQHFQRLGKADEYQLRQLNPQAFSASRFSERMYITLHGRPNPHPVSGKANGDILVYHLWLRVT